MIMIQKKIGNLWIFCALKNFFSKMLSDFRILIRNVEADMTAKRGLSLQNNELN